LGPSAAIYVTAKEPDKDIDSSTKLVIVAVARARNTAMMLSSSGDEIIERGQAPIKMEPVRARITIARPARPTAPSKSKAPSIRRRITSSNSDDRATGDASVGRT